MQVAVPLHHTCLFRGCRAGPGSDHSSLVFIFLVQIVFSIVCDFQQQRIVELVRPPQFQDDLAVRQTGARRAWPLKVC